MAQQRLPSIVGGAFAGAVTAGIFRLFLGDVVFPLGEPFNTFTLWIGVGTILGAVLGFRLALQEEKHNSDVAEVAARLGFRLEAEAEAAALGPHADQSLLQGARTRTNYLAGTLDDEPVQVVDCMMISQNSEGDSRSTTTTLILLDGSGLPVFDLQPLASWFGWFNWVNVQGVTFQAPPGLPATDLAGIEAFNRVYRLFADSSQALLTLLGGEPIRPEQELPIRRRFTAEVLRFLADHPGWSITSTGKSLAFSHPATTLSAQHLEPTLREAIDIARTLRASPPAEPGEELPTAPARPITSLPAFGISAVAGAFAGFAVGGFAGMALLIAIDPNNLPGFLVPVLFFSGPILGLFLGGYLGVRIGRWFARAPANPGKPRPLGQPVDSDAIARKHVGSLVIDFPARGFVRANGAFFPFAVIWNLILVVLLAIALPQALSGQMEINNERVSPWIGLLFLSPFVAVGVGSMIGVGYYARLKATLAVRAGQVQLDETTLFGNRQQKWPAKTIQRIAANLTGLHIEGANGPGAILPYRPLAERQWLARLLRQELGLEEAPGY